MATTDPRRAVAVLRLPPIRDYGTPGWYARLPRGVGTGGILALLLVMTLFIRVHYLDGQLWSDEANTVGIATHSLSSIPGVLWRGGGAPLYFWLLHVWMSMFGDGPIALHALSVVFGVLTVPVGMWLGWSLFGRRVGLMLATLMAFNPFLTAYAEEARPYELLALLGLIAFGSYLHVFVLRHRRGWLVGLTASLALLVYTDAWGFVVWAAALLALIPVARRSEDPAGVLRDAAIAFGGAFVVYLPWLPTVIHQAATATAPWHYAPLEGANFVRDTFGGDRVSTIFGLAAVLALVPLLRGDERRGHLATAVVATAALLLGVIVLSGAATLEVPLTARYLALVIAPLLMLVAIACARSGVVGLVVLIVSCMLLASPGSFIPVDKSDMKDVAGEMGPYLTRGDVVLSTAPEQAPLAWYYLPRGLGFATMLGPDSHPSYMDWDNAQTLLQRSNAQRGVARLVASMHPGQRLLLLRPLSEGVTNWSQAWSKLVRLRAAQWAGAVVSDPELRELPGVIAPHNYYRGACCIASFALVFVKR
jgi:4-amino-4-deoxy-L-arabinose transferase-like glycosyltransferase